MCIKHQAPAPSTHIGIPLRFRVEKIENQLNKIHWITKQKAQQPSSTTTTTSRPLMNVKLIFLLIRKKRRFWSFCLFCSFLFAISIIIFTFSFFLHRRVFLLLLFFIMITTSLVFLSRSFLIRLYFDSREFCSAPFCWCFRDSFFFLWLISILNKSSFYFILFHRNPRFLVFSVPKRLSFSLFSSLFAQCSIINISLLDRLEKHSMFSVQVFATKKKKPEDMLKILLFTLSLRWNV